MRRTSPPPRRRRGRRAWLPFVLTTLLGAALAPAPRAQSGTAEDFLEPVPSRSRESGPSIAFVEVADVPLPGPLPGHGPRLVGLRIEIPVAGALAVTDWPAIARHEIEFVQAPADPSPDSAGPIWVEGPRGRFRYAALDGGWIVAQKRCKRCRRGWRRDWRLRVSGSTPAPPLVTRKRVYFGALDNRVYSVKRKSGHRVWSVDVGGRVGRRLVHWTPPRDAAEGPVPDLPGELILAVPGSGSEIVALDAESGAKLATFRLSENGGTLVGIPLAGPDGRLVVARQRYTADDASLLVLELTPAGGQTRLDPIGREPLPLSE